MRTSQIGKESGGDGPGTLHVMEATSLSSEVTAVASTAVETRRAKGRRLAPFKMDETETSRTALV